MTRCWGQSYRTPAALGAWKSIRLKESLGTGSEKWTRPTPAESTLVSHGKAYFYEPLMLQIRHKDVD
jgi:hypothetical protein